MQEFVLIYIALYIYVPLFYHAHLPEQHVIGWNDKRMPGELLSDVDTCRYTVNPAQLLYTAMYHLLRGTTQSVLQRSGKLTGLPAVTVLLPLERINEGCNG